jgi:hypothetical protein
MLVIAGLRGFRMIISLSVHSTPRFLRSVSPDLPNALPFMPSKSRAYKDWLAGAAAVCSTG